MGTPVKKPDASFMKKLRSFPAYMADGRNSLFRKLTVVLGIVYILWPLDVLTDFMPVIGWLDDIGVLGLLALFMNNELGEYTAMRVRERREEVSNPKR